MAFYHQQYPQAMYAPYPMPYPTNQEYYMYGPPTDGTVYFDQPPSAPQGGRRKASGGILPRSHQNKQGFNNRKDSSDSGISDFSGGSNSRKTSNISIVSNASSILEESELEDVKEELPPFEEPDDEMCEKIVTQVEFYFSDANITKDKFLLKHVKRNKEGFVSLKLISSFKRVKHLTKDWRQVAFAIEKKSDRLEINDEKTKVKRLENLPEYDETTPSRTVVALNLPLERPTIEGVAEIFSACGDIVLIRILRPGNPIPADIKPFVNKHPEMTAKVCALVEFERTELALKAVKELNNPDDAEKMKVMELISIPLKRKDSNHGNKNKAAATSRRFSHAGFQPPQLQNPDQLVLGPRRRISLMHNMKFSSIAEEKKAVEAEHKLNPNAPTFQMQQQGHQRRPSRTIYVHPNGQEQQQQQQSAWMTRRLSQVNHDHTTSGLTLPPNVIRMPRGPDKTKGFNKWCRARMDTKPKAVASDLAVKKEEIVDVSSDEEVKKPDPSVNERTR